VRPLGAEIVVGMPTLGMVLAASVAKNSAIGTMCR